MIKRYRLLEWKIISDELMKLKTKLFNQTCSIFECKKFGLEMLTEFVNVFRIKNVEEIEKQKHVYASFIEDEKFTSIIMQKHLRRLS